MLSASSCTRAKDLHSPNVNEWYSSCYNNMLSATVGPHASVLSPSGLSAPATQQSRQSGRDSSTSSFLDASTPFQIFSLTAEAMEGIAAEFTRRRDRERYSDLFAVQKESHL